MFLWNFGCTASKAQYLHKDDYYNLTSNSIDMHNRSNIPALARALSQLTSRQPITSAMELADMVYYQYVFSVTL